MAPHPYCEIFPLMSTEEFRNLVTDIACHGLREPITTYRGKVLDGRNRDRACRELGVALKTVEFEGSERDALIWVSARNLQRRNLDASQRAACALLMEKHFADLAAQRKIEAGREAGKIGGKIAGQGRPKSNESIGVDQIVDEPLSNRTYQALTSIPQAAEQAAKACNANRQYIADAKKIQAADPALLDRVKNGEIKIPEAKRMIAKSKASSSDGKPKAISVAKFNPEKRWQNTTFPMLAKELDRWPKSFHAIWISYLREWATTLENSL